ncbi:homeobox-domain-containing protein [Auriscalpium vulgare]|uniref:Homeobox-domain-containing protein n=1 Tax=Auriscalpium vulgare TaxID=40419 RepID=A0ACB8SC29_9AGAM|nr:homeobox-domain-containing protein [Auriscalpium vulgare]
MSATRPDLSRTSSLTSVGSSDDAAGPKRTRKRFTDFQLVMLEQLFRSASHPSREEREALARELRLEPKSVTIWFQNRRQSERKAALNTNAKYASSSPSYTTHPPPPTTSKLHTTKTHTPTLNRRATVLHSPYSPHTPARRPRVKLDDMAARTEQRNASQRTRAPDPAKTLWDNMPSSPLAPRSPSPPPREYVELGRGRRTLEWACAAARVVGKERGAGWGEGEENSGEETEEEGEVVTPRGSFGAGDPFRDARARAGGALVAGRGQQSARKLAGAEKDSQDAKALDAVHDDVMSAALVLCGFGRRS